MTAPADRFRARLASGPPLLLDGAMGTELDRRGVRTYLPLWSALGLIDAPDEVRRIHRDYAAAGADILITDTFRTTGRMLARAGRDPAEASALDRLAVELARAGADDARRDVLVAGSIAPLEDCYSPWLSPAPDVALAEHRAQAASLAAAGADLLMVETMPQVAEAAAAVEAACETGLPVTAGFVLGADGRLLSGEPLDEAVAALAPYAVAGILLNCSPAPVIADGLRRLRTLTELPIGGYANAGHVDDQVGWEADESLSGETYAAACLDWVALGARIVGGCCGTRPHHIAATRAALDTAFAGTAA